MAIEAAIFAEEQEEQTLADLLLALDHGDQNRLAPSDTLEPLFHNEEELAEFRNRHAQATAQEKPLASHHGAAFLGIDAGSTTTKVILMDDAYRILYSHYGNNEGQPLETTIAVLEDLYDKMPADV